jgi:hypothetical protein
MSKQNYFEVRNTRFAVHADGVNVVAGIIYKRGYHLTVSEPDYYKACRVDLDGELIGVLLENEAKLLKAYIAQQKAINKELKEWQKLMDRDEVMA